ncbi:uncharacterized protein [Venturia canescens]|nr:uncharacterized protein LOC122406515 isoform X2 [Venturia canescens]
MTNDQEKNVTFDDKSFEEVLRRGLNDETISNVRIKSQTPAVGKGENFMSQMWRLTLTYSREGQNGVNRKPDKSMGNSLRKEISLIVKIEPETKGFCLEMIRDQKCFVTETKVFKAMMPEMEKLLKRSLAPKCFYAHQTKDKRSFIVLEDLKPLGFATKDRQSGLSRSHVSMVLEALASFHAASVRQREQNPELVESFTDGLWMDKTPKNMFRAMEQSLRMVTEKCRDWPEPEYRIISEKLRAIEAKFAAEILDAKKYEGSEFCVLNHGDCWVNNIMFREDENGEPLEVRLVDFQLSVYSSPVIDLVYFLSTCLSLEIQDDFEVFFNVYLERLRLRMETLGCRTQPPTIEELRRAAIKRRMYRVMAGLMLYPRMLADVSEIESFDQLITSGQTRMNIFKNPAATIAVQRSLLFMHKTGYLD